MTISSQLKLTPAQKRFLEKFDLYTGRGALPREYHSLRDSWKIQHRTMNWCMREGLLVKKGVSSKTGNPEFVVSPDVRTALGLSSRPIMYQFIRRRRRRSSVSV